MGPRGPASHVATLPHPGSPLCCGAPQDPANASPTRNTARVAPQHAEVHVVGQLAGASGFSAAGSCVAASWQLVADPQLWLLVRGTDKVRGQVGHVCVNACTVLWE